MKLIKLWVDGYKNLSHAELQFSSNQIPTALIGNNGTGKSNVIEVLAHIFMGLYYDDSYDFDFIIEYIANDQLASIGYNRNQARVSIQIDGILWSRRAFKHAARKSDTAPFPSLVFFYYSGSCERLEKKLRRYERSYSAKLRKQENDLDRRFVFTTMTHAEWILLGLLCHQRNDILPELTLANREIIKFKLSPPKNYDVEVDNPTYWSATGAVKDFLSTLDSYSRDSNDVRTQVDGVERTISRTYYIEPEGLYQLGSYLERRRTNLYSIIQALSANKILTSVTYEIESRDTAFTFDELSEGEKQILAVIGGATLTEQDESLILLDEPDTHLNPSWSWKYSRLLSRAMDRNQTETSSVLLATHDPILISGLPKEQVIISNRESNGVITFQQPVRDPKGQGIANILTSEFFGLPSSLDIETQDLMERRITLAYKSEPLSKGERAELKLINEQLDGLGLSISERDPDYSEFLAHKYGADNRVRNDYAHGSNILHNDVLGTFEMVSEFINQLYIADTNKNES